MSLEFKWQQFYYKKKAWNLILDNKICREIYISKKIFIDLKNTNRILH